MAHIQKNSCDAHHEYSVVITTLVHEHSVVITTLAHEYSVVITKLAHNVMGVYIYVYSVILRLSSHYVVMTPDVYH